MKVPTCNHERAHIYPRTAKQFECQFIGYHCNSYAEFEEGKCADCGENDRNCKPMELGLNFWIGINKTISSNNPLKNFYLETNNTQPFCLFHYQILVYTNSYAVYLKYLKFNLNQVQISRDSSLIARGKLEISLNQEKNVSISRSFTGRETGQDSGFKAGTNYTKLYLDENELEPNMNISIKWSSLLRNTMKIDKISINFMSHFDKK